MSDETKAKIKVDPLVRVHFWMTLGMTLGMTVTIATLGHVGPSRYFDLIMVLAAVLIVLSLPILVFVWTATNMQPASLGPLWIDHAIFYTFMVIVALFNSFVTVELIPFVFRQCVKLMKKLLPMRTRER